MFTKLKSFFKTTAIYGLVGSIRSFTEFLLLPLYARFLSPEDFGIFDILMIYVMVGLVIAILEMNNAAFRFFFDSKDISGQRKVISTAFASTVLCGLSVFAFTLLFADSLAMRLFNNTEHSLLFIVVGVNILLSSIITVPVNLLRIRNMPIKYTSISLIQVLLTVGFLIWFLAVKQVGIIGIFQAKILAMIPTIIVCLFWARSYLRPKINFKLSISMLKYALPIIPIGVSIWGINGLNRLFMLNYLTLEQIGLFSLASKFVVVITLTVIAFQLAWPQFAFSNMNSKTASKTFSQVFNFSSALGIWLVIFITMFSGDIIRMTMNKEFYPAAGAIMPLALGMFFYGVFYFFTTSAIIKKKTSLILAPIVTSIVFNVVLNLIITPVYGFKGTAWVTLFTYFVMASSMYLMVRHSDYVQIDFKRVFKLGLLSSIFIPVSVFLALENTLIFVVLKVVLLLVFPVALWISGYISKTHITALLEIIRSKSNRKIMIVKKSDKRLNTENSDQMTTAGQSEENLSV